MSDKAFEEAIKGLEKQITETLAKHDGEVAEHGKALERTRADLKKMTEDFDSLLKSSDEAKARIRGLEQQVAEGIKTTGEVMESWGTKFVNSEEFANFKSGRQTKVAYEVKNTILGESGSPQNPDGVLSQFQRLPGIVDGAFRSLNVLDFVPTGTTAGNAIEYVKESSWTNDAAETAEAGSKPESDLTFELVQDYVRTIAHFIKASKQSLDDAPALASYIDRRMRHGIQQRLQSQILKGNGTSPNIAGLSASGRHTAFTPISGENAFDSINRAKYAVIAADYTPSVVMLNPADWGAMERLKSGTSDDRYLASGGAALSYINNGLTPLVWGMPVVASNDVASGKFYVMSSDAIQLFMRQGAVVEMFEQDGDNVTKNLITIRAELRAALAVYRPAAVRYGDLTL